MMAGLFLIFVFAMILVMAGKPRIAVILSILNLFFAILLFFHHATDKLKILL